MESFWGNLFGFVGVGWSSELCCGWRGASMWESLYAMAVSAKLLERWYGKLGWPNHTSTCSSSFKVASVLLLRVKNKVSERLYKNPDGPNRAFSCSSLHKLASIMLLKLQGNCDIEGAFLRIVRVTKFSTGFKRVLSFVVKMILFGA